jgi:hypothetical protein
MKNLATAVLGVMRDVKGMEKNSKVGAGTKSSYDGTKDQDVKEIFNEALAKHGLCMLPIGIEEFTQIDRWEEEDAWSKLTPKARKQKQSVFTKVTTKYLLLHESGESVELAGYGHGIDSQDKGAGKATTYAMKNALLYAFVTPVGKMDDSETTHSNSIETPKKAKPWLNKGTPEFTKAQSFLKGGGKIASIEAKYIISKETKELLTK